MNDNARSWQPWFQQNRRRLANNGLYLDGGEPGRQTPVEFSSASVKILICRLSTYDDVLPSISHRMLYWAARQIPGVYVDLAFFPPPRDAVLLKKDHVPLWLASGCKMSPRAFDIVAISISVPQEAFNLPVALRDSGLHINHEERMADSSHPLVLLGGHAAGSVPFVYNMVDILCLGDGIVWLQELLNRFTPSKSDLLRTLAKEVEGTYVPSFYRHVYKNETFDLKEMVPADPGIPFPVRYRVDNQDTWIHGYDGAYIPFSEKDTEETLPLAFGCVYRCRFCQTGWLRKALDPSDSNKLRQAAVRLKSAMAASDLNLLASDACSVPALSNLVAELRQIFPHVSVKSVAVSSLEKDLNALYWIEKREFTFGIEGISLRLRAYLGKPMDVETLIRIVHGLTSSHVRQMKLFFIATGLEIDEDIAELDLLLRKIKSEAPGCRFIASFMPLFHAPFTPLQFDQLRVLSPELCQRIERVVKNSGVEFRWSASPSEIRLMNLLCRAGRAAAPVLTKLSIEDGVRYYKNLSDFALHKAERMLDPGLGQIHRESSILPWDDLEAAVPRSVLWKSFKKAKSVFKKPVPLFIAKPISAAGGRGPGPTTLTALRTLTFWIQIAAPDAPHPDVTLARKFLRELFVSNPGAAQTYGGNPRIQHPRGTSGLALLTAQFGAEINLPVAIEMQPAFDELVFLVELETSSVGKMIELLRADRIPFQTQRLGNEVWSRIAKGYRNRTGLLALCGRDLMSGFVICRSLVKYMEEFDARVTAVFEKKGKTLRLLKSIEKSQIPQFLNDWRE